MHTIFQMLESLEIAVRQAGGKGYTTEELMRISAAELIEELAPNFVRFEYTGGPAESKDVNDTTRDKR